MKPLFKIIVWLIGGLILLAAGLAVLAKLFVDPNDYKPQISSLVEKQIGRKLVIDGDLELTFFPWLGVTTGNVALSNPPGFDEADMLTIAGVEIRARVMPLFSGRLEADTVVLRNPSVHLIVDGSGATNWQDLAKPAGQQPESEAADPGSAMAALAVRGLDLKGGRLIWEDRQAGGRYVVDDINLDVGEILSQKPVDLSLGLKVGSVDLEHPLTVAIDSSVALSMADSVLVLSRMSLQSGYGDLASIDGRLAEASFRFDTSGISVDGLAVEVQYAGAPLPVTAGLDTSLDANLEDGTVEFGGTTINILYGEAGSANVAADTLVYRIGDSSLEVPGVAIDGRFADEGLEPVEARISGAVKFDAAKMIAELSGVEGEASYGSVGRAKVRAGLLTFDQGRNLVDTRALQFEGAYDIHQITAVFSELTADIAGQELDAPAFEVNLDGVPAKGSLVLSDFLGDANYSGNVATGEFSPAGVIDRLGLDYKAVGPEALATAAISMKFSGGVDRVRLDDLNLRLDQTNLTGFVEASGFPQPAYQFEIDVDDIDVDQYVPRGGGSENHDAGAAVMVLPVGLFRGVRADGKLRIGNLRASGVKATDIDIGVASSEDELRVKPISAALYGGTLNGDMHFTDKEGEARLRIQQTMDQVEVGGLLADTGVTDRISGKGRLEMDVAAIEVGGQPQTRGVARFHFFDGAIKGFDLRGIYLQARRIYNERKGREEEVESDDREEFRFTELNGTLEFDERTARNEDLEIKSPLFRIEGRGTADLSANRLDYLVLATVVESAKGQGGEELAELKGVTLPIRISGGLDSPVYSLDVAAILKLALQQRVEQEVERRLEEKLEEKLGDELKEQLGNELQKLFKID